MKLSDKKRGLIKFSLLVAVIVVYFLFVSWRFGAEKGFVISVLTWSFFVLCTPVAAAGFLFDFPIRLVSHVRMFYTELTVWASAAVINIITFFLFPGVYDTTLFLKLFYHILSNPIPYWGIIVLSASGTFLSITLADEFMDISKEAVEKKSLEGLNHKMNWHRAIISVCIIMITVVLYEFLLNEVNLSIPLF